MGLFKSSWKRKEKHAKKVLKKAIFKNDEKKLYKIAKNHSFFGNREEAIVHLKNETMLYEIATDEKENKGLRHCAIKNIKNQSMLEKIVRDEMNQVNPKELYDIHGWMIYYALKNIEFNQSLFEDLIENFKDFVTWEYLTLNLEKILGEVIDKFETSKLSEKTISLIWEIAQKKTTPDLRMKAYEKVESFMLAKDRESTERCKREICFIQLVLMMNSEQAKKDRRVGYGYSRTTLPSFIIELLKIVADDKQMLKDLREKLMKSHRAHNFDFSWRYHYSMLKEIDKIEGNS